MPPATTTSTTTSTTSATTSTTTSSTTPPTTPRMYGSASRAFLMLPVDLLD
jgi:hypothetical protein